MKIVTQTYIFKQLHKFLSIIISGIQSLYHRIYSFVPTVLMGERLKRCYLVKFCKLWQIIANSSEGAVSSGGSTVHVVRAAEPVGLWAASSWAWGLSRSALLALGQLHELGLLGNEGAVGSSGSTVHVVRAAEPVGLWAAASRAWGLPRSALTVIKLHFQTVGKCHEGKDCH